MKTQSLSKNQWLVLVALRISIGWYIMYQGIVKFYNPVWSSKGYLLSSDGIFRGFFTSLASNDSVLMVLDVVNIYGQIAIGVSLILGLFSRYATLAGIVMLSLYYLAHPPFVGLSNTNEGILVNNLFVLIVGLIVLSCFPTSTIIGMDSLFKKNKK